MYVVRLLVFWMCGITSDFHVYAEYNVILFKLCTLVDNQSGISHNIFPYRYWISFDSLSCGGGTKSWPKKSDYIWIRSITWKNATHEHDINVEPWHAVISVPKTWPDQGIISKYIPSRRSVKDYFNPQLYKEKEYLLENDVTKREDKNTERCDKKCLLRKKSCITMPPSYVTKMCQNMFIKKQERSKLWVCGMAILLSFLLLNTLVCTVILYLVLMFSIEIYHPDLNDKLCWNDG